MKVLLITYRASHPGAFHSSFVLKREGGTLREDIKRVLVPLIGINIILIRYGVLQRVY